jgi:hypothetical protein
MKLRARTTVRAARNRREVTAADVPSTARSAASAKAIADPTAAVVIAAVIAARALRVATSTPRRPRAAAKALRSAAERATAPKAPRREPERRAPEQRPAAPQPKRERRPESDDGGFGAGI